jgi:hypothetical protein
MQLCSQSFFNKITMTATGFGLTWPSSGNCHFWKPPHCTNSSIKVFQCLYIALSSFTLKYIFLRTYRAIFLLQRPCFCVALFNPMNNCLMLLSLLLLCEIPHHALLSSQGPPPVPILGHMNPTHSHPSCLFKMYEYFNIVITFSKESE